MSLITYRNRMMNPGIYNFLNDVIGEDSTRLTQTKNTVVPAVNIKETEKSFELEIAVPGLRKKDININLDENVLTISSKTEEEEKKEDDNNFKRREFHYATFKRSFTIPEETDENKIEAKHENGVLSISIPKKEVKPIQKKLIKIA